MFGINIKKYGLCYDDLIEIANKYDIELNLYSRPSSEELAELQGTVSKWIRKIKSKISEIDIMLQLDDISYMIDKMFGKAQKSKNMQMQKIDLSKINIAAESRNLRI